jgi:hypothetical protein
MPVQINGVDDGTFTDVETTAIDGERRLTLDSNTSYTVPASENGLHFLNNVARIAQNGTAFTACSLLSKTTIALNANADTTLFTVPTGFTCVLSHAILIAGANANSTDISIGRDGTETDFVSAYQCDNLDADGDAIIITPVPNATAVKCKSYAAGVVIQAKVENQAGGATNALLLFGYLY